MSDNGQRGPLEDEVYRMTRADLPGSVPGTGQMEVSQLVVVLMGHLGKIEEALLRLARELDQRAS